MIPLHPVSVADTKAALRTTAAARAHAASDKQRARHDADLDELLEHLKALMDMAADEGAA